MYKSLHIQAANEQHRGQTTRTNIIFTTTTTTTTSTSSSQQGQQLYTIIRKSKSSLYHGRKYQSAGFDQWTYCFLSRVIVVVVSLSLSRILYLIIEQIC